MYTELALSSSAAIETQAAALWIAFSSAAEHSVDEAIRILNRLDDLPDVRPDHAVRILNAHGLVEMNANGDSRAIVQKCELAHALLPQVRDPFVTTGLLNLYGYVTVLLAQMTVASRSRTRCLRRRGNRT